MSSIHQKSIPFSGDAFRLFQIFKDRPQSFFLDSSLRRRLARFSYIGHSPVKTVHTWPALKRALQHHLPKKGLAFPAGAVGYFGYDGQMCFGIYDTVLIVDHHQRRLIASGFSKSKVNKALESVQDVPALPALPATEASPLKFQSNATPAQYLQAVRRALKYIRCGDIYQINLSHQVRLQHAHWQRHTDATAIYAALRRNFPSEFGAYYDDGRQVVLSTSPEQFLTLQGRQAQVKPMKGTRPRGKTKAADLAMKRQLWRDPKEIAELLMVTDLERNDLGQVCDYGSIKVKALRSIEPYTTVFQATSTVEGRLRKDCDRFDLLHNTFPSGSVTGCPKMEAMKIIKQLERGPRGLYTGALGYISFSGDMAFSVLIRTMVLSKRSITFHVGGGIVAESDPQAEWEETWVKAKPLMQALGECF